MRAYEDWVEQERVDLYPGKHRRSALVNYDMVALAGEIGELLGEHKKNLRGTLKGKEFRESVLLEAGDALHYLVRLLHDIGSNLEEALIANVEKLENRKKYGKGKRGKRS